MAGNAGRAPRSVGGTTKKTGKMTVRTSKSGVRPATGGKNLGPAGPKKSAGSQVGKANRMLRRTHTGPGIDGAGGTR